MTRKELTAFLLIFLLAAGLRFAGITFDSLWLDESYQTVSEAVAQPLPDLTRATDQPFLFRFGDPQPTGDLIRRFRSLDPLCPPLYAVLLNCWMKLFGQSDLSIRSLSALFSLASLVILFFTVRSFLPGQAAIAACFLQAISPFDIYYAQEARMYMLETLAALLSCASLLYLLRLGLSAISSSGRQRAAAFVAAGIYSVSTCALINSHYTALFCALFQGLFATWLCLRAKRFRLFMWLCIAWAAVLLLWLPWLGLFKQAAAVRTASFYVARAFSWWWPIWAIIARVPFNWLVFLSGRQVVAYAVPIYITSAVFLTLSARASVMPEKVREAGESLSLKFFWAWAIMPPLAMWLVDVLEGHRVVEISRYLIATAPAIYALAGYGAVNLPASFARYCSYLLIVHSICAMVNNAYAHMVPQREPWKQMAALVEKHINTNEPLFVSQHYDIICLDRYLNQARVQIGISPQMGGEHVKKLVSPHQSFWLLTAQDGEAIVSLIPSDYKITKQFDTRHALHLRHFSR